LDLIRKCRRFREFRAGGVNAKKGAEVY